ncbi:hypothetical protein ACK32U_22635 [Aeromonas dhakensis]|uniref:Uncharacterized protein n=1 Tax=Aeromonas dhakensis TaxID=196024 RepID=K1JDK4_9GAMM|nr:hypothetical protein [Aeromonas dhakensis]EKB25927.1 hypothetical protein HMPREF1171_04217 [Aeromonas dhakensis]MBL0533157.1 hypothetical protein [Aeromonas dhakensis]TNI53321.1 hypothetical protein CF126_18300 [Aeromonas dhakensis]
MKLSIKLTPEMRIRLMHTENLEIEVPDSIVQEQYGINANTHRAIVLESIVATLEQDGSGAIEVDGRRYVSTAHLTELAASLRQLKTSGGSH